MLAVAGSWWLPEAPMPLRAVLGVGVVALGIAGDLFESMLKRSAGVKDSSALIPGHGGILDRIDALLFAAPVYYVVLKYCVSVKRIAILGSTGSIGQSALAVVDAHADRLRVVGLAAGENAERLAEQIGALPAGDRRDGFGRGRRPPDAVGRRARPSRARDGTGWSPWRRIRTSTSCCARRPAPTGSRRCWPRSSTGRRSRWRTRKSS